jgi:hypothetical protein
VLAPLAVAALVYAGLWHRYNDDQASARTLPEALAKQFAQLPAPVSSLIAVTLTDTAAGSRHSGGVLRVRLRSQVAVTDAPGLHLRARVLGAHEASISFAAAHGRAGCAAVRFASDAAVGIAYDSGRRTACRVALRRMRGGR